MAPRGRRNRWEDDMSMANTRTTEIIEGAEARKLHKACVRIVIHANEESWIQYAILDRHKVNRLINAERRRLQKQHGRCINDWLYDVAKVDWSRHYGGPGAPFAHAPFRIVRGGAGQPLGKRWIVWQQMGGLDI